MSSIQQNDLVTLTFTGKLDNGEIFKTVTEEHPLIVRIGNLEIPPTLEEALLGMAIGETKTVRLSPDEGYGPRRTDLVQTITNAEMIKKIKPKPGMILSLKLAKDGEEHYVPATVLKVGDSEIEVDYNHPLAGHHITYTITVVNIERQDTTADAPNI
jgi:FKBP-type peptidyl-prolyl cis-trans isomerase 2